MQNNSSKMTSTERPSTDRWWAETKEWHQQVRPL